VRPIRFYAQRQSESVWRNFRVVGTEPFELGADGAFAGQRGEHPVLLREGAMSVSPKAPIIAVRWRTPTMTGS
jgi:hypothetical protein